MNRQAFLTGKTHHGDFKVKEHGCVWDITRSEPGMVLLKSLAMTFRYEDTWAYETMWVDLRDDKHFNLAII